MAIFLSRRKRALLTVGVSVYEFTVPEHGEYAVIFVVDTYTGNSLYLNVDADPEDPVMIWDVPGDTRL